MSSIPAWDTCWDFLKQQQQKSLLKFILHLEGFHLEMKHWEKITKPMTPWKIWFKI